MRLVAPAKCEVRFDERGIADCIFNFSACTCSQSRICLLLIKIYDEVIIHICIVKVRARCDLPPSKNGDYDKSLRQLKTTLMSTFNRDERVNAPWKINFPHNRETFNPIKVRGLIKALAVEKNQFTIFTRSRLCRGIFRTVRKSSRSSRWWKLFPPSLCRSQEKGEIN